MSRTYLVLVCLAAAAFCSAQEHPEALPLEADVQIVDDIETFEAKHSELELIPLTVDAIQPLNQIRYTYGQRVFGDRIVAQGNNNFNYPNPQNSRATLSYPQGGGFGSIVSFVEILVDQTSNLGNAYIAAGGIGQRRITVIVEARNTYRFGYRAVFYGYN